MMRNKKQFDLTYFAIGGLVAVTVFSGALLRSTAVSADDVIDDVAITIPVSCSMSGNINTAHTATMQPNSYSAASGSTYENGIGKTTLTAFCNDQNGFSIYAIGYTGDVDGDNTLVGTPSSNYATIATGIATSGNTSNWAMKVNKVENPGGQDPDITYNPQNMTITNSFNNYHAVPNDYMKVAEYHAQSGSSATDVGTGALGAKIETTYAAFISSTQTADTYTGQVKYVMVHPYNAPTPVPVSRNLYYAITGSEDNYTLTISDFDITSGAVDSGPVAIDGYTFDEEMLISNTPWISYDYQIKSVVVSGTVAPTSTSAWFAGLTDCDSWNLSGLKTDNVTDMSYMFYDAGYNSSSFSLDLSSWNTGNVIDMSGMFSATGYSATTWSVGNLSSWNTANVTDMSGMFSATGYSATTWSVGDISSWNTVNVTDMSNMFNSAGYSATSWNALDLSSWNTINVTNMSHMFSYAGGDTTTWSIGNLSSWNTANVTDMSDMFNYAGYYATTWAALDLSLWNTSSVTDMSSMFYEAGSHAADWSVGDLSLWNTANVTNMNGMFSEAGSNSITWSVGDLSLWNTANVERMDRMFAGAGYYSTTWSVGDLSLWNTVNVTTMRGMFSSAGSSATTWSVGDLSSWNTSSVTDMYEMFANAGTSATIFTLNLSSWDTSGVTTMYDMFRQTGASATTFILDLSSWNTTSVTDMSGMLSYAGYNATTWSVTIPKTNNGTTSGSITNTTSRLYGCRTSYYATPPSGKSFTLAN